MPARRAAQAMARTLAALHSVRPADVGLDGYGKPSGYNRRQVWRWGQQYRQSVVQVRSQAGRGEHRRGQGTLQWYPWYPCRRVHRAALCQRAPCAPMSAVAWPCRVKGARSTETSRTSHTHTTHLPPAHAPQGQPMPEMMRLHAWLEAHVPATDGAADATCVSHGDYRCGVWWRWWWGGVGDGGGEGTRGRTLLPLSLCGASVPSPTLLPRTPRRPHLLLPLHAAPTAARLDNLVYDAADPSRVLAVLDWELSTLGDPLADLAYSCMPYHLPPVRVGERLDNGLLGQGLHEHWAVFLLRPALTSELRLPAHPCPAGGARRPGPAAPAAAGRARRAAIHSRVLRHARPGLPPAGKTVVSQRRPCRHAAVSPPAQRAR